MPNSIILWSLSDIFQNLVDEYDSRYYTKEYREEVAALEYRLETILNGKHALESDQVDLGKIESSEARRFATLELYRLTSLIYLERASQNFSGTSQKLDAWIDSAFQIMERMRFCKQVFPIFIISCEAQTEEQRIIVLDCIQHTAQTTPSKSLEMVKGMVQNMWNIQDLEPDKEINYMAKLDAIISIHETMPSFA